MDRNNGFRLLLATVIIAGFFLPWFHYDKVVSGWVLFRSVAVTETFFEKIISYTFLLIPLFALFVFIRSLSGQYSGILLRSIPFLITAMLTVLYIIDEKDKHVIAGLRDFFSMLGFGYFMTAIGSLLLVFAAGRRRRI